MNCFREDRGGYQRYDNNYQGGPGGGGPNAGTTQQQGGATNSGDTPQQGSGPNQAQRG